MTENTGEVDLIFLYKKFKDILKRGIILLFKALNFILKKWRVIAVLLVIGVGLGIYSKINSKPPKKANILLRVNFDAVNYVYSTVDVLNQKIADNDSIFLSKLGLNPDSLEIKKIDAVPHINIKDIIEKYEENDRSLEAVLRNLEINELFDENETLLDRTFMSEYKYHNMRLYLSSYANEGTIDIILNYINNNEFLEELRVTVVKNIEEKIKNNTEVIDQIDRLLDTYYTNESLAAPSSEIYVVDKNFSVSSLLTQKVELQNENEELKKELVYSKDIAVAVNTPRLVSEDSGITSNKVIFYPFVLIMLFLLFSFAKYIYRYLKEIADNS